MNQILVVATNSIGRVTRIESNHAIHAGQQFDQHQCRLSARNAIKIAGTFVAENADKEMENANE